MSLQYAILGLLNYNSMTGYDLKKMFDEAINNFWAASLSQIYRELGTMENKCYLASIIQEQKDRPDKKIYSITEDGKTAFKQWITNFPQKLSKEKRDEFTLRIFFGSNLSKEQLIEQFRRYKLEQQSYLEQIISLHKISENYVKQMKLFNNEDFYWKFILKRATMSLEMLIKWCDECMEELQLQE